MLSWWHPMTISYIKYIFQCLIEIDFVIVVIWTGFISFSVLLREWIPLLRLTQKLEQTWWLQSLVSVTGAPLCTSQGLISSLKKKMKINIIFIIFNLVPALVSGELKDLNPNGKVSVWGLRCLSCARGGRDCSITRVETCHLSSQFCLRVSENGL